MPSWPMPTDRFSHTFRIAAPAAAIYAHLLDPQNYIGLSPLVVAVRDVHPVGDAIAYTAVERFRFGPLSWNNRIRVTMTGTTPDRQVRNSVVSPGAVRLIATVDLVPDADGTIVTETIELRSPAVLRRFALGQAKAVQRVRSAELTRRMEMS
jgi:carbon monoxide dehydrogenase subunit G